MYYASNENAYQYRLSEEDYFNGVKSTHIRVSLNDIKWSFLSLFEGWVVVALLWLILN